MSDDEDVFDTVAKMGAGSQAPPSAAPEGDVFEDVAKMPASAATTTVPSAPFSVGGALRGAGEAALSVTSGTGKAIGHAVNDLLPEGKFLGSTRAQEEQNLNADPFFNYKPQTHEGKAIMDVLGKLGYPLHVVGNAVHDYVQNSFGKRTADVVGDVATLAPFAVREAVSARGMMKEHSAAIEQGHPLSESAEMESGRLADIKDRAQQSGFDLPESGSAERHATAAQTNTPLVNASVRDELNLPQNAPLTPQMLTAARAKLASPAYQAIEEIKDPIALDQKALAAARAENMNGVPSERLPFPEGESITGAQAVDFSKKARFLANTLEKNKQNPFASQDAQMYRDAAEAVEDSVADHLTKSGNGELAENWDNARKYVAKTYSVQGALDGAGNVRAADLKTQLFRRGKRLSGSLEDVANLAAQYPEAFKTTRITMPQPGLIRRSIATVAPIAGAGVGGALAGGTGAVAGEMAGSYTGQRMLNR